MTEATALAETGLDPEAETERLSSLAERILTLARREGADGAEVGASVEAGLSVTVRKLALETVEFNRDRGFGITVYYGQRKGSASTSDASDAAIAETVRAACNIARFTEEDEHSGLADASLMARELPALDLYHPWSSLDVRRAERIGMECEAAALGFDRRIDNSEGATVSTHEGCRVYANSHGFLGTASGTRHGVSCAMIARNGDGMQRDYWYDLARDADELGDAAAVGREAARRTVARLGARPIATGRYPVLFTPEVATGLIGHLLGALSGSQLYRNASFLKDSLGRPVLPSDVSVAERPHLPKAIGSAAFDADGVATSEKPFVEDGLVASYVLGSYSARRLGLTTTGNAGGVHNVVLIGTAASPDALKRTMHRGLVVTELMGQGVNLVTGDYSRGAAGYWVEDGKIVHPVQEVTIASNLKDMYLSIAGIGDDVDVRGNIRAGSMLIEDMTVAAGG